MTIIHIIYIGWLSLFMPSFTSYDYDHISTDGLPGELTEAAAGYDAESREKVDRLLEEVDYNIKRGEPEAAAGILGEAEELLNEIHYREGMARAKAYQARILLTRGDNEKAIDVLAGAYELYKDTSVRLSLGNLLATAYRFHGIYDESLKLYTEMLELARDQNDTGFESAIEQNLAVVYEILGDRAQALERYYNSLEIAESESDTTVRITVLNNIGDLYMQLGEHDRAERFLYESLDLAGIVGSKTDIYSSYINLGVLNRTLGRYEKAMGYYEQSLEIAHELGNRNAAIQILFNIGNIYLDQEMYDMAEDNYLESLEKSKELGVVQGEYFNNIGLGDVYLALEQYEKANNHYRLAYEVASSLGSPDMQRSTLERLTISYEKAGLFAEAYEYQKQYQVLTDSLQSTNHEQAIARFQTLFDLRQERQQNEILQEKLQAQNLAITAGIISLVILIVAALVLMRMYRQKQHSVTRLISQNDELEKLNRQVDLQKRELSRLNKTKDKLFSILAHDLRSPISRLQSLVMLIRADALEEVDKDEVMKQIDRQLQRSISTFENYLNWTKSQMQGLEPNMKSISLYDLVGEVTHAMELEAENKNISFRNLNDRNISVFADEDMLRIVLQNLLSNALKYSKKGGVVTMDSQLKGDRVVVSVRDTGVGIQEKEQENIFTAFAGSLKGTDDERGTGFGLSISKEFIQKQNGRIWLESTYGKGSVFYIELDTPKEADFRPEGNAVLKMES